VQTVSTPPRGRENHVDLELSFAAGAASDVAQPSVQDRGKESMPALRWSTHRPSHARQASFAAFFDSCSVSSERVIKTRLVRVGLLYGLRHVPTRKTVCVAIRYGGEQVSFTFRSALNRELTAPSTATVISSGQKLARARAIPRGRMPSSLEASKQSA
jgi:hypothetical protein